MPGRTPRALPWLSLLCTLLAATLPAHAQQAPNPPDQAKDAQGETTCTDVQVGSASSYDCLNAQLRALAGAEPRPSSQDAPLSATSPGYQAGAANASATANRLGANWGKSAIAARPAQTYSSGFPH